MMDLIKLLCNKSHALLFLLMVSTINCDILGNQKDRGVINRTQDVFAFKDDNIKATTVLTVEEYVTLANKDYEEKDKVDELYYHDAEEGTIGVTENTEIYVKVDPTESKELVAKPHPVESIEPDRKAQTIESIDPVERIEPIRKADPVEGIETVGKTNPVEDSKVTRKPKIIEENKKRYKSVFEERFNLVDGDEEHAEENLDGENHPCYRKCESGKTMTCRYKFDVEWYESMSKACYNCPYNLTDCDRKDCIPGDGKPRSLTVINRKLPGPSVEVCLGDTVVVDVTNSLLAEGTTVHWHGHHQRGTPYMDGAPLVTQCPIPVGSTFRYTITAAHSGTHFWHSHAGMQRADGAFGAFVVREPKDRFREMYDYDRSSHVMIVLDWTHELGISVFTSHHHSDGDNKPPSLLVNGRGRFQQFKDSKSFFTPAARFDVEQGYRYRFRIINAEFLNCPIEMSIDKHNMTIISSDGNDIEPVEAVSLVTYAGERFDFIVEANQEIDNYWIRFRGLMDCDERFTKARQVSVLHYEGALDIEPDGDPTWEESHREGLQVNALNKGTGFMDTIAIPELTAMDPDDPSMREEPDIQYYVSYDFYAKDNSHFHKLPYYGFNQVPNVKERLYTPQLNHISMKMQSYPLLPGRINIDSESHFCNESTVNDCKATYCECTHVVNIPLYSVVELIMVDEGITFDANHPFHLHGYAFRVVAMDRVASNITVEEVKQLDAEGKIRRKLKGAPLKDTVTVPDGGYTVIRFYADNPGYWLYHCHIEFHAEIGMALVFKVGEHSDFPPVPNNFPQCGDYLPGDLTKHKKKNSDEEPSISITQWWPLVYFNNNEMDAGNAAESIFSNKHRNFLSILLCFSMIVKYFIYCL